MRETKDVRILVVEDEPLLRMAVAYDFKRRGFQVCEASNGRDAYNMLVKEPVDIVLTDVRMPGGDGIELLDRIKARNNESPIVILMTGYTDLSLEEALAKGADTVFPKPFDRKALVAIMQEVVTPKKQEWSQRKCQRIPADFSIQMKYENTDSPISGRVYNISRGGMFIVPDSHFPQTGSVITFTMPYQLQNPQTLEGRGIVRRIDSNQDCDTAGFGIDFEDLSPSSITQLHQLINDLKTTNFFSKRI
jgi:CheY-like chemotaxis protein